MKMKLKKHLKQRLEEISIIANTDYGAGKQDAYEEILEILNTSERISQNGNSTKEE